MTITDKQPRIGAHLPVGKGLKSTADEAVKKGIEVLQIFLRNPRGRKARKLTDDELECFNNKIRDNDINPVVVHIPYICNPASIKKDLYQVAYDIIREELERCELVKAEYLVLHPGAYTTSSLEEGIKKVSTLLNRVLDDYSGRTIILLETMAGQGTEIGKKFGELNQILQNMKEKDKIGICFDTCHIYAAGYDCSSLEGINSIIQEMDKTFGKERVKLVHVNDSSYELGSRHDRHAHIGQGFIGKSGFKHLVKNDFFKKLPFILETDPDGQEKDIELLKNMREKNA